MEGVCKNNKCVLCEDHSKCHKCGWNPDVFERRRKRRREQIALAKVNSLKQEGHGKTNSKWKFISL